MMPGGARVVASTVTHIVVRLLSIKRGEFIQAFEDQSRLPARFLDATDKVPRLAGDALQQRRELCKSPAWQVLWTQRPEELVASHELVTARGSREIKFSTM
jgi:hypothetical protein